MKRIIFDKRKVGEFVCMVTHSTYSDADTAAIGIEEDGNLIAGFLYDNYNGANICLHVASIAPGWITRKLISIVFDYPFNQLKVNRVTGLIGEKNVKAIDFANNLGAKLETRLKDAHEDGDLLVYVLFKEDCRFIRGRYVKI